MSNIDHVPGFPLRLLVNRYYIGIIIGRFGNNLRLISAHSKTRIDITPFDDCDKLVTIYGNQRSCSKACRNILELIAPDQKQRNGMVSLCLLTHNHLVGRLIGKNGYSLHYIRRETFTDITINKRRSKNNLHWQRTITITSYEFMYVAVAEALVSKKLRLAYYKLVEAVVPAAVRFTLPSHIEDQPIADDSTSVTAPVVTEDSNRIMNNALSNGISDRNGRAEATNPATHPEHANLAMSENPLNTAYDNRPVYYVPVNTMAPTGPTYYVPQQNNHYYYNPHYYAVPNQHVNGYNINPTTSTLEAENMSSEIAENVPENNGENTAGNENANDVQDNDSISDSNSDSDIANIPNSSLYPQTQIGYQNYYYAENPNMQYYAYNPNNHAMAVNSDTPVPNIPYSSFLENSYNQNFYPNSNAENQYMQYYAYGPPNQNLHPQPNLPESSYNSYNIQNPYIANQNMQYAYHPNQIPLNVNPSTSQQYYYSPAGPARPYMATQNYHMQHAPYQHTMPAATMTPHIPPYSARFNVQPSNRHIYGMQAVSDSSNYRNPLDNDMQASQYYGIRYNESCSLLRGSRYDENSQSAVYYSAGFQYYNQCANPSNQNDNENETTDSVEPVPVENGLRRTTSSWSIVDNCEEEKVKENQVQTNEQPQSSNAIQAEEQLDGSYKNSAQKNQNSNNREFFKTYNDLLDIPDNFAEMHNYQYMQFCKQVLPQFDDNLYTENVSVFACKKSVSFIIGKRGYYIRAIKEESNAEFQSVEISPKAPFNYGNDRKMTITGNGEAQWKAQYLIFSRLQKEGFGYGPDNGCQIVEIFIPDNEIGRVIGINGRNIVELQRLTGCTIRLPSKGKMNLPDHFQVPLHIYGNFIGLQNVIRRIHAIRFMRNQLSARP